MAGITGVPHVIPHRIHINGGDAAEIQARIRGAAAQTAVILAVQNNAGTNLFTVDNDGDVSIAGNLDAVVNETITGNITLTGALTVNGNTTLGDAGTDTLTVAAASTFNGTVNLTNTLVSTSNGTFSGFVSSTVLNLPRRGAAPATMGATGRIYTFAGDADTTELWYRDAAGNDVQITDAGGLDGASVHWDDDEQATFGNTPAAPDCAIEFDTAQTNDAWMFGVDATSRSLHVCDIGDMSFNFANGAETNPTLFIHSAAASTTQFMELRHNGTEGEIETGVGSLIFQQRTVTPGAALNSVTIAPTYGAENFAHAALALNATQNGANSVELQGMDITLTKATGATVLDTIRGIRINAPVVAGTVTNVVGIAIGNMSPVGGTVAYGIQVSSQTANATTTRAVEIAGTGVANAIRMGGSANIYANAAENIRFTDSTNANGIDFTLLATADQNIRTTSTTTGRIVLQNATFTPGATHTSIMVSPVWAAENFQHTAVTISANQNGANSSNVSALRLSSVKATGATILDTLNILVVEAPSVTGTVTSTSGIFIENVSSVGGTASYAINIASQTANATTTRAIEIAGSGVNNAIRLGATENIFSQAAGTIRMTQSTNVQGLDFILSTTSTGIRTILTTGNTKILLQDNTFTPGEEFQSVDIRPVFAAENFGHTGLVVRATQNGANTQPLNGIEVFMIKATGATVLGTMVGILVNSPVVTGTVTSSFGIDVESQTDAGIISARAMRIQGTGITNSFVWGGSALQYANAAENIRFADSTNANGLAFDLLATANQSIRTISTTTGAILLQNQTFTAGANHNAVSIIPTWAAEDFQHFGLEISPGQNGANSAGLFGINIAMRQVGAGALIGSDGLIVNTPTSGGSITTVAGIRIADQSLAATTTSIGIQINAQSANATTTRAINLAGTGVANAIRLGNSSNIYSPGANTVRITDATDANGLVFATPATAAQEIRTVSATTGSVVFQSQSFTAGATHNSVAISPVWATENFSHTALAIAPRQNGDNSVDLQGIDLTLTKATDATTLTTMRGIRINAPAVTGTVTNSIGIALGDISPVGGTTAYALQILSQTANATTTRAIEIAGTGVNNAIRFGASANAYSNGANNIRFMDATNARGIDFNLSAGAQNIESIIGTLQLSSQTEVVQILDASLVNGINFVLSAGASQELNTPSLTTGTIVFQNQTFTAGASHLAVQITPTWATENFSHTGLFITTTQNGANSSELIGETIRMAKATGATILASMVGLQFNSPSVVGTVTAGYAINISSQTDAGITTARAIRIVGTGASNAIELGDSPLIYSSGAEVIRFDDSTAARGISMTLTAAGAQTISATAGNLIEAVVTGATTQFTTNALQTMLITGTATGVTVALAAVDAAYTASTALSFNTAARTANIALSNASGILAISPATSTQDWTVGTHFAGNTSGITITQSAITAGSPTGLLVTGGAHTTLANADLSNTYFNLAQTKQFTGAAGVVTIDNTYGFRIAAPNYQTAGAGALTITTASTLYINAAPGTVAGGGGTTITNAYAFWVDAGAARFDGRVLQTQGADIASATNLTLGSDGNSFEITGVTTIDLILTTGWQNGSEVTLIFNESLTVRHGIATSGGNVTILLSGAANFAATANDTLTLILSETTAGGQAWRQKAAVNI